MNQEYLEASLHRVNKAVDMARQRAEKQLSKAVVPKSQMNIQTTKELQRTYHDIGSRPLEASLPSRISRVWTTLINLERRSELSLQLLCIDHSNIMIGNMFAWTWLTTACLDPAARVLRTDRSDTTVLQFCPSWLKELVWTINSRLFLRRDFELASSDYITGVTAEIFCYHFPPRNPFFAKGSLDLADYTISILRDVLVFWLGFPNNNASEAQGLFVHHLLLRFSSPGILFLEATWKARNYLRVKIMGKPRGLLNTINWPDISHSFSLHPLANIYSPEHQTLQSIAAAFQVLAEFSSASPLDLGLISDGDRQHSLMKVFLDFLKEALVCIDPARIHSADSPLQKMILSDLDFYLPYREHGTSRKIVRDSLENPYSIDRLKTKAGFFDEIVFRAITQAAPILIHDHHVHFDNLLDFIAKSAPGEHYACNQKALGGANVHRRKSNVDSLWNGSCEWESFLLANPKPEFHKLWDFVRGARQGRHYTPFTGVGDLTAYLVAADYAYTPLVDMPSVDSIGEIILKLNKGAMSGLRMINLLPSTKIDRTECIEAVSRLYGFLSVNLTTDEKVLMGFDTVMTENSLCKFKRLDKQVGIISSRVSFLCYACFCSMLTCTKVSSRRR